MNCNVYNFKNHRKNSISERRGESYEQLQGNIKILFNGKGSESMHACERDRSLHIEFASNWYKTWDSWLILIKNTQEILKANAWFVSTYFPLEKLIFAMQADRLASWNWVRVTRTYVMTSYHFLRICCLHRPCLYNIHMKCVFEFLYNRLPCRNTFYWSIFIQNGTCRAFRFPVLLTFHFSFIGCFEF